MYKRKPETTRERDALHQELLHFARRATYQGTTKGLARLVSAYQDQAFTDLLIRWLEEYTPIRKQRNEFNALTFLVPIDIRENYDLAGARLNPYYSMETKEELPKATIIPSANLAVHQLSDRELMVKILRQALRTFINEGSADARRHLIDLIQKFPMKNESVGRKSPFLQGGAPGLGKR